MSTPPRTIDDLLAKLQEEQTVGWHGVTKPSQFDQLPLDVERRLAWILDHPSVKG